MKRNESTMQGNESTMQGNESIAKKNRSTMKKNKSTTKTNELAAARFWRGQKVEVRSEEMGYLGSYYAATILAEVGKEHYYLQYETLLTDDESAPLREVVSAAEIRRAPPHVPVAAFEFFDPVDAFANEGWWVGEIIGRKEPDSYTVFFRTTGEVLAYPVSQLRPHQEFVNGEWSLACST